MKTIKLLLLLGFVCFFGKTTVAQIELPDATKNALEKYNKEAEERENENLENDEAAKAKKENEEAREAMWLAEWEEAKEKYGDGTDQFDTKELNCVFLLVLYMHGYEKLVDRTNNESNCQTKYDLLGTQAVAIALSTTLINCAEPLAKMNYSEFNFRVYEPIMTIAENDNLSSAERQWYRIMTTMLSRYMNENHPVTNLNHYIFSDFILRYFRPEFIVPRSLEIANVMEALGCGGY